MRGVPGWQLTLCIVTTLLRGAESIRMIYRARAGTFFCIFFVFLARGSVGSKSMLWVCGTILPFFFVQDFDQILRLVGLKKRTLVSRDLSHTHTRA